METPKRQPTRAVRVGQVQIGAGALVAVQSMCTTKTRDFCPACAWSWTASSPAAA